MKYSVLDLACLRNGQSYKEAYDDQVRLAQAVNSFIYDQDAQIHSFELLAQALS
ncbi:MAG: hypothetical protein IJ113_07770 [Eggerthellaceae bacterium]|nr:hypothetical protein [Eggerthellaceae bacterium]